MRVSRTDERDPEVAGAGHEVVDHVSEITLRLRAPGFPALLDEATRAFGALLPAGTRQEQTPEARAFRLPAGDRAAALVGWLNEMVYLVEIEEWLPVRIDEAVEEGSMLHLRARGVRLSEPFVLVKAATLHRARVDEVPGGLSAEVTLDV